VLDLPGHSVGFRALWKMYDHGLWMCGRSALPTGSASHASRAGSESRETLAFADMPTAPPSAKKSTPMMRETQACSSSQRAEHARGADLKIGGAKV